MKITLGQDLRRRSPAPVYDLAAARRRRLEGDDEPTPPAAAGVLEVAS